MRGRRLVGVGGYAESGKDAVAEILERAGWRRTYMSRPLEQALVVLDPWIRVSEDEAEAMFPADYEGARVVGYVRYARLHRAVGYGPSKRCADVRAYLQRLGDEVGRQMIYDDVWVDIAFRQLDQWAKHGYLTVVTGVRYQNEADAVRSRMGLLVWVDRGGEPVNSHASDNSLGPEDFDMILDNRGTLHELQRTVLSLSVPWS